MNKSQIRRQFSSRLSRKANILRTLRVQLGDFNGHMYPDYAADPNMVFYRHRDQVHSVRNLIVTPILDLWVRIGTDPIDGQFQVLKVDAQQGVGQVVQVAGPPPSSRYSWGGQDPVIISGRQITGFRPSVNNGMILTIGEGLLETPTNWMLVEEQTFDLSDYRPADADTAAFVKFTLDVNGDLVVTPGDEVSPIADLIDFVTDAPDAQLSNIPASPADTLKVICACRVYKNANNSLQEALYESMTNTDLVDLRWWSRSYGVAAKYRQFVYEVSGGDFTFVIDADGNPVMALESLEQ